MPLMRLLDYNAYEKLMFDWFFVATGELKGFGKPCV